MTFAGWDVPRRISVAVHLNGVLESDPSRGVRRAEERRELFMGKVAELFFNEQGGARLLRSK